MSLTAIANHLEGEGLGTQGSSLFINFMPFECKTGILLRTPLSGTRVDYELPGYFKCDAVVVVRAPEYMAALTLMQDVMKSLTIYEQEMGDIYMRYIRPASLPVSFPVSDGQFYEVQVRFEMVYMGDRYGIGA